MRIPQVGRDVLFTLRPASPDDSRPAENRPAKITKVLNYSATSATCNIMVTLDGNEDLEVIQQMMQRGNFSGVVEGFSLWMVNSTYNAKMETATWHYADQTDYQIEQVLVELDITHGREIISAGAIGAWDQKKNSITFDRKDIGGISDDQIPTYPANKFFDLHIARLTLPDNYFPGIMIVDSDGSESPEERKLFIGDLMRMANDRRYARDRMLGLDAPQAGSIRKAREMLAQRTQGKNTTLDNTGTMAARDVTLTDDRRAKDGTGADAGRQLETASK